MKVKLVEKFIQLLYIIDAHLFKNKCSFLKILEYDIQEYINTCKDLGTEQTEELQDVLFHIHSYLEIPETVRVTMYPDIPKQVRICKHKNGISIAGWHTPWSLLPKLIPNRYLEYLEEVEKQRAVERFYILESLKNFPFGLII